MPNSPFATVSNATGNPGVMPQSHNLGKGTLNITGTVIHFARMDPAYARLVGQAGTDIKKAITITREKAYPFKILGVKARNGNDIVFRYSIDSSSNCRRIVVNFSEDVL